MVDALSPASLPKNSANAGSKSLVEMPRRYSTGSTSATLGDRRAQGGRMALVKRRPSRRSLTRGAWTSSSPAAVVTVRGSATPLRTTSACPCLISMLGVLADVLIHLGFERRQQHASGALPHQRIQIQLERILFGLFRSDYSQHAAYLSLDGLYSRPGFNNQEGTPRSSPRPRSTTSGYSSRRTCVCAAFIRLKPEKTLNNTLA